MLLHCEPTCRLSSSLRGCSSLHTASWRLTGRASASRCMTWATARTTSTDVSQTLDSQEAMPNVFWEQSTVWLSNTTLRAVHGEIIWFLLLDFPLDRFWQKVISLQPVRDLGITASPLIMQIGLLLCSVITISAGWRNNWQIRCCYAGGIKKKSSIFLHS